MNGKAMEAQRAIDADAEAREAWAKSHTCADCDSYRTPPQGRYGWCVAIDDYTDERLVCWHACDEWR
ncbi:hypothetical protein [Paratractidigestivibacter sp.]|uniref:hypothetical protein n=1 Tax=Paratractidigestivibacter sp. TaxID=2847316 RepID=UPI002ABE49CD|nr:hypothetical protein [Paratractidigestivibacter sp.]